MTGLSAPGAGEAITWFSIFELLDLYFALLLAETLLEARVTHSARNFELYSISKYLLGMAMIEITTGIKHAA